MSDLEIKDTNQFLTFTLGDEVFALDIGTVREVLELLSITRIPRTPAFMRGVINLRGHAVPVVDMRLKFGMEQSEDTVNTCIIITEVEVDGDGTVMGALCDSVREVVEIPPEQIDPPPRMGTGIKTDFIKGMASQEEEFIMLLDINKVFSAEELALLMESGSGSEDESAD